MEIKLEHEISCKKHSVHVETDNKDVKGCCRGVECDMGTCISVRDVRRELVLLTVENDRHEIYS